MRKIILGLVTAFAAMLVPLGIMAAPAQAAGTEVPVIVSPTTGQIVANGYSDGIVLDFSNAPADTYYVSVYNGSGYDIYNDVNTDGTTTQVQVATGRLAAGEYSIDIEWYDNGGGLVSSSFTVAAPPPPPVVIDQVSTSPTTFYPTVRDGYRDGTSVRYRLNQRLRTIIKVQRNGTTIRSTSLGNQSTGRHSWTWDGRRNNGDTAQLGNYRIAVTGTAANGRQRTVATRATVATGYRSKHVTKTHAPRDTTTRNTRGCSIHNGSWSSARDLWLDCVGGSFAEATYRFSIPANARNLSWSLPWESDGSMPWGKVTRSGERISNTAYSITARVTQYRGMFVHNVVLEYTTRARI